tara:strand:- start:3874 stop:5118 length:1245 start_codon:yes stop_codon:yes gene_type:complete
LSNFKSLPQIHHGIIDVGDLPIPFDIVLNAAVLVVVLTFVFLKVSWKESILTSEESLFSTRQSFAGKTFGFLILLLLIVPGLINNESAKTSITPLILWIFLWIAVPVLGLIFGDLYAKFNPLAILVNREGVSQNVYFASFLFLCLTWFELVWNKPGNPRHIGIVFLTLLAVISLLQKFYKKTIIEVDPLLLLHHLYSKMRVTNKSPMFKTLLNNISNLAQLKGMEYFILLMIGTVTYDGLRETTFWFDLFGSQTYETFFSTVAFIMMNLLIIIFYRFACYFAIRVSGEDFDLNEISLKFGHTMLPIAFAYHVTHYLSLLLFEFQTILYRLNDPLGFGWNLFNIQEPEVNYFLEPIALWTIMVIVTLAGHMLSVVLAHDLSVKLFGHQKSDKTQYIFLFITVALTLQALFVLSVA